MFAFLANAIWTMAKSGRESKRTGRRAQNASMRSQKTESAPSVRDRYSRQSDAPDESLDSRLFGTEAGEAEGMAGNPTSEKDDSPEGNIAAQAAQEAQGVSGIAPTVSPAGTLSSGIALSRKAGNSIQLWEIKKLLASQRSARMGMVLSEILGPPKGLR